MTNSTKKLLGGLIIANIVGWLSSFYSLWDRAKVLGGAGAEKSFCNISETINCSALNFSAFGSFLGIPMGSWGLLYFTLVLIFTFWARLELAEEETSSGALPLIKISSWVGLAVSVLLFCISAFVIKAYCPACLVVYLCTAISFALSLRLKSTLSLREGVGQISGGLWLAFVLLGSLTLFAHKFLEQGGDEFKIDKQTAALILEDFKTAKTHSFDLSSTPSKGAHNARVKIIEFSDYQCPHCARAATLIPQLLRIFPKDVALLVKGYPLNSTCNPAMQGAGHPLACLSAKYARCVYDLSGDAAFFKMHEELFANQSSLNESIISQVAEKITKKSSDEILKCVNSAETHSKIVAATEEGTRAGIEGTPTFYINGKRFRGGLDLSLLQAVIEEELKTKK